MNYIDAHSHIWTPETKAYPLRPGFSKSGMKPLSFTADQLQQQMKPVGVNRVVLIQMSFYAFNNSYMLDAIQRFPGMFSGVAVIDHDAPRPDLQMQKMKQLGVRGFRISPRGKNPEQWLGSTEMHRMWSMAADERLNMCCLIGPDALPALDRMCRDCPDTPVVIDHLCRIGASGKINPQDVKMFCDMARHQNLTVKVSAFYALGKKKAPYQDLATLIKQTFDAFGPQRLMWASDAPFQVMGGHSYKASIDLIKQGLDFLSNNNNKQWLLNKTAERVFFQGV